MTLNETNLTIDNKYLLRVLKETHLAKHFLYEVMLIDDRVHNMSDYFENRMTTHTIVDTLMKGNLSFRFSNIVDITIYQEFRNLLQNIIYREIKFYNKK